MAPVYDAVMRLVHAYREELIVATFALRGDERVVDLGGGTGYYARYLAARSREVLVVDRSAAMLARAPTAPNIRTLQADVLQTGLPDQSADAVLLSDVVHHVPQQDRLFAEVYRILAPGGLVLVHDFEASRWRVKLLGVVEWLLFGTMYYRTCAEMSALLARHRFSRARVVSKGWYYLILAKKSA